MLMRGGKRAAAVLLAVLVSVCAAGCGTSDQVSSGGAACARSGSAAYFANARVVFVGTMLAGRAVNLAGRRVLVSPARVRVIRYLKGGGPGVVTVQTAVVRPGVGSEDGIEAQAGQKWKIYTSSRRMPYETSICGGSKLAGGGP